MDPETEILAALGLLLTQVRVSRRALEDVQRSTARYGGFEFARAFAEGARFGQPPMFDGALMVHVVNINDLAPGNSFGGFIEAIFGGIGNFFGNLIGGVVGGTLSGFRLHEMLGRMERIVANIRQIVERLGIGQRPAAEQPAAPAAEAQAQSGESLLTTLDGIRQTVREVTALFQAAGSGPGDGGAAAARTSQLPMTQTGERWMAILNGVNIFLDRTGRLLDGLILLIPMAIGGISFLIANLGGMRRAILETIQFILRIALILRGVLLTVAFETVASAARLAASIVGILGETIQSVLRAIFGIVGSLLEAAFDALETLTNALQAIVRSLLQWLVDGVFNVLRAIGELTVFRTIDHIARILPSVLTALYVLKTGAAASDPLVGMLTSAHQAAFPPGGASPSGAGADGTGAITSGGTSTTSQIIGEFPTLQDIIDPLGATLRSAVSATGSVVEQGAERSINSMRQALTGVAGRFEAEAGREAQFSRGILDRHGQLIRERAGTLADAITAPIAAEGPPTGLEAIANAYESWLSGGGLNSLLGQVDAHFRNPPAGTAEPSGALRLLRGDYDRPRARVEIDRVEIVIDPAAGEPEPVEEPPTGYGPGDYPLRSDEDVWLAVRRHEDERDFRCIRDADPRAARA